MMKREIFKLEGEKIVRLRKNCPKCGDGIFLAEHKDRLSCGKCGYTEFKGGKDKRSALPLKELKKGESTEKIIEETTGKPVEEKKEEPVEKPASKEKTVEEKSE